MRGAVHRRVGGIALQQAYLHRLALLRRAHAGLLAQHLGRTDPRAVAAEAVLLQDVLRRAAHVVGGDLTDEAADVDAGLACLDARRVVADVHAAGLAQPLLAVERRMPVAAILRLGGFRPTLGP